MVEPARTPADYTGSGAGVTVDLTGGSGSGGDAQGDVLSSIENLVGSSFGDILYGDGGVNSLYGGDGIDALQGGAGADLLDGGGKASTGRFTSTLPAI